MNGTEDPVCVTVWLPLVAAAGRAVRADVAGKAAIVMRTRGGYARAYKLETTVAKLRGSVDRGLVARERGGQAVCMGTWVA